ncbi:MAG: CPBP family intramembrane glutamic endopeptidase [Myxococcota bacterium]
MQHTLYWLLALALTACLAVEIRRTPAAYRALKEAVARGEPLARIRFYRATLRFELVSGSLAALACAVWPRPWTVGLESEPHLASLFGDTAVSPDFWVGFGTAALAVVLISALVPRRRATLPGLPDFGTLLPTTLAERGWFALVALSAGVCEEIVFRGWLLQLLHGEVGLQGLPLVVAGAAVFGIAHAYQGVAGVLLTGLLGAWFTGLLASTGGLWVPIVVHVLVDLRWAFQRGPRPERAAA